MSPLNKNSRYEIINEFVDYLSIEKGLTLNTQKWYKKDLELLLEFTKLDPFQIREENINGYIQYLRDKYSSYSVLRKISSIKNFYRFLKAEKKIEIDPCKNLSNIKRENKIPEVLKIDEIKKIIASINNTPEGIRDRMILKLLFGTGARISEIINLKIEDVDSEFKFLKLFGKGNKRRLVPIYYELGMELKTYILTNRDVLEKKEEMSLAVFPGITRENFWNRLKRYAKDVGITKNVYPHILRHSVATLLLENKADIRIVQEIMGHASIATTELYTHVEKSVIRNMYDKIKIGDI